MRPAIDDLIRRMTDPGPCASSETSISWHAYREAERLLDRTIVDELVAALPAEPERERRDAAYFIIGLIGINLRDPSCAEVLIASLAREDDPWVLRHILEKIRDIPKPRNLDLDPIYACFGDRRWQVRLGAIDSLSLSECPASETHVLNQLALRRTYGDIESCNLTLASIGSPEAIPAISAHLESRSGDVRSSAKFAIRCIEKRSASASRMPWPHVYARVPYGTCRAPQSSL